MQGHRRPIVVPLDGSKNAEAALPIAVNLARTFGAPLRLVHVVDPDDIKAPAEMDRAREMFTGYAESVVKVAAATDHPHDCEVVTGPAAQTIIELAENARMIVLASHGRSGLRASLIGSVADKVVRGATVPTLVVPLGSRTKLDSHPVLVALDGSKAAEHGLEIAREIAAALKAEVALVRAYSIPPPAGIEFVAYPVDLSTTLEQAAQEYLNEVAKPGEKKFCLLASATDAISEAAEHIDAGLVVMTSHGKGFAQRIALGSTTDRAMHSLRRPLLIVPVPHGEPTGKADKQLTSAR